MPPASVPMLSMRWARRNTIPVSSLGDVGVDGQDGVRLAWSSRTSDQRLSTRMAFVFGNLAQFAVPFAVLQDALLGLLQLGQAARERTVGVLAAHFGGGPAINALGAFVPEQQMAVEIAHGDGVARLVEQRGLLADLQLGLAALLFEPAFLAEPVDGFVEDRPDQGGRICAQATIIQGTTARAGRTGRRPEKSPRSCRAEPRPWRSAPKAAQAEAEHQRGDKQESGLTCRGGGAASRRAANSGRSSPACSTPAQTGKCHPK